MKKLTAVKIVALVFPGAVIAILLLFAFGEIIGGDWSGLGHVFQAIPVGLLMWVGWRRPVWGGIFLFILGLFAFHAFVEPGRGSDWLAPFLIVVAPLCVSGLLLLVAARLQPGASRRE
jgi:hypothetical protein